MALKKKLVLAVVNPQSFYLLAEKMREIDIKFEVPSSMPFLCSPNEVVLYDERSTNLVTGNCEKLLVTDTGKKYVMSLFPRLAGKEMFEEIAVGIDLGSISAFIVVGDGSLLMKGKVPTESLGETIKDISSIPHEKMIVRVGSWNETEELWGIVADIVSSTDASVEVVDEHGTTRGSLEEEKDPDIRAAKAILKRMKLG
ncbi:MAG: hypothetical protein ACP5RO_06535 [Fervidicoccaceae archaeon]